MPSLWFGLRRRMMGALCSMFARKVFMSRVGVEMPKPARDRIGRFQTHLIAMPSEARSVSVFC